MTELSSKVFDRMRYLLDRIVPVAERCKVAADDEFCHPAAAHPLCL